MAFVSSLALANEFIDRSLPSGVDHMKAQKLVFLTQGFFAADYNQKLTAEDPEVWPYGPVFRNLYSYLKHYRDSEITEPESLLNGKMPPRVSAPDAVATIDMVWDRYKAASAVALSRLTHLRGSPWQQIAERHNYEVPRGTIIPFKMIRDYFRDHAKDLAYR